MINVDPRLVKTSPQTPVVYLGLDNDVSTLVSTYDGKRFTGLDLSTATRLVLILLPAEPTTVDDSDPQAIVFDSATLPGCLEWSAAGVVTLVISDYDLTVGSYDCQLLAYDPEHTDGQMVVDNTGQSRLTLEVREGVSSGLIPVPTPDDSNGTVRIAGEELSALRVVYELDARVYALSPDQEDSPVDLLLGLTLTAGAEGSSLTIKRDGTIDQSGWAWTPGGLIFLAADGTLTQTPPTTGWEVVIGVAASATRLNISIDEPVLLA